MTAWKTYYETGTTGYNKKFHRKEFATRKAAIAHAKRLSASLRGKFVTVLRNGTEVAACNRGRCYIGYKD